STTHAEQASHIKARTVRVPGLFSLDCCAMEPSARPRRLIPGDSSIFSNERNAVALKQMFDFQTMPVERGIDAGLEGLVTFAHADSDVILKEEWLVFRRVR